MDELLLMSPGPTMVPENVLQAGARPMVNHRTDEFSLTLRETLDNLKTVYGTRDNVFVFAGSGRTGVEAALVNVLSPGGKVLVGVNGNFGDMMATICKEMGYEPVPLGQDWTRPLSPDDFDAALQKDPSIKTVGVVHNETSTGVVNDIKELATVAHRHGAILVVDGVSSVAGMPINLDTWEIDLCATGSQKCLMSPPGLGIVAVRQAAWDRVEAAQSPRYYMDFRRFKEQADKALPSTPGTSSISLVRSLCEALRAIVAEGMDNVYGRHSLMAEATRAGIKALDLPFFPPLPYQSSPTVVTAGLEDARPFLDMLLKDYAIHLGRGLGKLAQSTFRIGVMGAAAHKEHIVRTFELLGDGLVKAGLSSRRAEAGAEAALKVLA